MAYNSLENFYRVQFALRHLHKWSIGDMNDELPWEREIHIALLNQHLEEEEKKLKEQAGKI